MQAITHFTHSLFMVQVVVGGNSNSGAILVPRSTALISLTDRHNKKGSLEFRTYEEVRVLVGGWWMEGRQFRRC